MLPLAILAFERRAAIGVAKGNVMHWNLKTGVAFALVLATSCVWGQGEPAEQPAESNQKLIIGAVAGLKRPDGFIVEDLRPAAMKLSSRRQTYKREFRMFRSSTGPLAKFENNIGDAELNISPVDFMAEQMILRYGEKLGGKRLLLREFSFTVKESIDRPQSLVIIPLDPASIGVAIIGSLVGTAIMSGSGRSLELLVKIDAEMDGKRLTGSDFGSIFSGVSDGRAAKIVDQTFTLGFYNFEKEEPPAKREVESPPVEQGLQADATPVQ